MATIYREVEIAKPLDQVWEALSDVANIDKLLSYLEGVELDGNVRSCAMDNGATLREVIISNDPERHRLAYSIIEEPFGFEHHSAAWEALPSENGTTFVWTTDVLPDRVVDALEPVIDLSVEQIRTTIESR